MKGNKKVPELLVPANNLDILKYAVNYGADAVYAGGKDFNLRSIRGNFTFKELREGVRYAHDYGKKVYFTLNSIVSESELDGLKDYLKELRSIDIDGIILADFGALELVNEILPKKNVHISTQVNLNNSAAANFFKKLGAKRVNIAREVSFPDLKQIINKTDIEVEVFVHGALCISYSGRCMLSKYMTGRDSNKGKCAHSCRWRYYLMEEERPNTFFPVLQDKNGTYIYNSRDLCLIGRLKELADAGVSAVKLEGRMKTENYVGLTTWAYRKALGWIKEGKFNKEKAAYLLSELDKCSHRNFTEGFMFAGDREELEDNDNVGYIKKYRFVGVYHGYNENFNGPVIEVKNKFRRGEIMDILEPGSEPKEVKITGMISERDGVEMECANPNDLVILCGAGKVDPFALFRIKS
ncbi:MAG: U32 family peptidase [Actinomycetota bacterium]|nr:U32 family peptidase [Actinomycetota bacterium]